MSVNRAAKVAIVKCPSYKQKKVYEAVKKAINELGFKFKLNKNSKVLIKPSVMGSYKPSEHVTTHPAVLEAIIKILKKYKCRIIIGESSYANTDKALEKSGIIKLGRKYAIEVITFETAKKIKLKNKKAKYLKQIYLPKIIREADLIINTPKFKTHVLTKYTGAVKNLLGCIAGEEKRVYHRKADTEAKFSEFLIELYQKIKPQLNILDGIVSMEGQGPSAGKLRKTRLILASNNAIALDCIAARTMGLKEDDVITNKIGKQKKLVGKIKIIGKIKNFNFEVPQMKVHVVFSKISKLIPLDPIKLNKKKCRKCYLCVRNCPVKAMKISKLGYPKIKRKKCIRCFCCIESCPEHALYIKERKIRKLKRAVSKILKDRRERRKRREKKK